MNFMKPYQNILIEKLNCNLDEKFLSSEKLQSYHHDNLMIKYQKEYNRQIEYKDISFKLIDNKNNQLFIPCTIEKNKNFNNLNYYGFPINIDQVSLKKFNINSVLNILEDICLRKKVINFFFKISLDIIDNIDVFIKNYKSEILSIEAENYLDLNLSLEEIQSGFNKGHKSAVNRNYPSLKYEIYDKKNYKKNEIFEMQSLHNSISKKKTRSDLTWKINEEMILNDNGILIKVLDNTKVISYAFIYFNSIEADYFSSCTIRDYFKKYNNITHKIIWKSIEYLKYRKVKKLYLGPCKTYYTKNISDFEKINNIQKFKNLFGGHKKIYVNFNQMIKKRSIILDHI